LQPTDSRLQAQHLNVVAAMGESSIYQAQPLALGGTSRLPLASGLALSARSGSGIVSARSGSSTARSGLETPRTDRGFCSSGTPRDLQRLALGERPPDSDRRPGPEGWGGLSISPQQTARSSVFSSVTSEAWSMTPSSQGEWSSRSRADSLNYSPEQDFAMACAQTHAAAASAAETASYHMDLQKSLEVMRFVIMKENQKLKELLQESRASLKDFSVQLDARESSSLASPPHGTAPTLPAGGVTTSSDACVSQEPSQVEWCLRNMADVLALGRTSGCQAERTAFRLPAFPGLDFELRFHPWSSAVPCQQPNGARATAADVAATWRVAGDGVGEQRRLCELQLDVIGASASLDLHVALSISVEGIPEGDHHSQVVDLVLSGGGRASCVDTWPIGFPSGPGAAAAKVVCRVEVEELSWGAGHLSLSSCWQPPPS